MNDVTVCSTCYWLSQNSAGKTCTNPGGPCPHIDNDVKFSIFNKSLNELKGLNLFSQERNVNHA